MRIDLPLMTPPMSEINVDALIAEIEERNRSPRKSTHHSSPKRGYQVDMSQKLDVKK